MTRRVYLLFTKVRNPVYELAEYLRQVSAADELNNNQPMKHGTESNVGYYIFIQMEKQSFTEIG